MIDDNLMEKDSMQLTGEIKDISIDYESNKPKITILLNQRECLNSIEELKKDKFIY